MRGLPIVLDSARSSWHGPLDVVAAFGHGRSYGAESRVLGRALPGILQCGLWEALDRRSAAPTATLLTDIGNDILYGATAAQIARWVARCLEQLRPLSEKIVVTQLPLTSLKKLGPRRFRLMRTILFPKSRLQLADALETAGELNERVVELAQEHGAQLVEPAPHWYGIDPIHVKRRHQGEAWQTIFLPWSSEAPHEPAQRSFLGAWKIRSLRHQTRKLFGNEQRREQPSGKLKDGSLISLY